MKKTSRMMLQCVGFGITLALLAGCWPGKKSADVKVDPSDVVLLSIDSKPVITKSSFHRDLSAALRNMDPTMLPKNMQRKFLDDLKRVKLTVHAAKEAGIHKDPEFVKAYDKEKGRLKEMLMAQMHEKKIFDKTPVSDTEAMDEYEKNKSKYIKEPGGTLVKGVSFKDDKAARAFYDKVKSSPEKFESIGKKDKDGKFRNFGRVSQDAPGGMSMVPEQVKEKALKAVRLPVVDMVKAGKEMWVICILDKTDPVHADFHEIADQVKNQVKVGKFMEDRKKRQEDMEKKFTVDVNEDFFKEPAKEPAKKHEDKHHGHDHSKGHDNSKNL